jgi:hypothetical protein
MKTMLLAIGLLIATSAISQEKYLSITNLETGKEKVFKQNHRVKIKTLQGGKLKGNLLITDENQVMISNINIPLSNIERIKRNPLALNILVSGTLIYFGVFGVIGGIAVTLWSGTVAGLLLIIPGAGLIYGGLLSPNFLPAIKTTGNNKIIVKPVFK